MARYGLTEGHVDYAMAHATDSYDRSGATTYMAVLPDGRHMKVRVNGDDVEDAFTYQPPPEGE